MEHKNEFTTHYAPPKNKAQWVFPKKPLLCFSLKCETWREFEKVYSDPSNLTVVRDHRKADHETRPDLPSEQTKHQLTLMCSWFLQPLRGVKWFGQRKLLFASTKLPAAIQLSLA